MQIFLLDIQNVTSECVQALALTLPPLRRTDAERCRRKGVYEQKVLSFCLLRYAVRQIEPTADVDTILYGKHGKPYLAQGAPFFNLSHTPYGIAAVTDTQTEVGVDLEKIRPHFKLAARAFSREENQLIALSKDPTSEIVRLWSAKEAAVKRTGEGIGSLSRLQGVCTDGVQSQCVAPGGVPHWLSVCPADRMPPITYVTAEQLMAAID